MTNELSIEILSLAMRAERMRAEVAAQNIAAFNTPGAKMQKISTDALFAQLKSNLHVSNAADVKVLGAQLQPSDAPRQSLDEQVAEVTASELRYRVLTEAVSRQMALMTLAASGRT